MAVLADTPDSPQAVARPAQFLLATRRLLLVGIAAVAFPTPAGPSFAPRLFSLARRLGLLLPEVSPAVPVSAPSPVARLIVRPFPKA